MQRGPAGGSDEGDEVGRVGIVAVAAQAIVLLLERRLGRLHAESYRLGSSRRGRAIETLEFLLKIQSRDLGQLESLQRTNEDCEIRGATLSCCEPVTGVGKWVTFASIQCPENEGVFWKIELFGCDASNRKGKSRLFVKIGWGV